MKQFLTIVFSIVCLSVSAQPLVWPWAAAMGGRAQIDSEIDMAIDSQGDVIMVGNFEGARNFGSVSLSAVGNSDVYICKYDSSGNVLWAIRGGDQMVFADANGVTVDANDNIYVVGRFAGTITFDTTTAVGIGNRDIFMAKFSPAGELIWVIVEGGLNLDAAYDVECDLSNNSIYMTGSFLQSANFGPFNLTSSNSNDENIFLVKYNSNGVAQWAISEGGTLEDRGLDLKIDGNNNIYMSGYFSGTAQFDAGNVSSAGARDMFVAKYSSTGVGAWVKAGGGPGTDIAEGVGVDSDGNVYVAGVFTATATFSGISVTEPNSLGAMFIAKYTAAGTVQWVKKGQCNSPAQTKGLALFTDNNGFCYVTGYIGASAVFSGQNVISSGGEDAFVAKYNTYGKLMWITHCGGTFNDRGLIIKADQNGICYIGGIFIQTAFFGPHSLVAPLPTYKHFLTKIRGQNVGVGIDEVNGNETQIQLYPNPVGNQLTYNFFSASNSKMVDVRLYDTGGNILIHDQYASLNGTIDTEYLPTGNYILSIFENGKLSSRLFTKD